jgi:hypothetical protein
MEERIGDVLTEHEFDGMIFNHGRGVLQRKKKKIQKTRVRWFLSSVFHP